MSEEKRLAEIAERAEKATPGPWRHIKAMGQWMCWLLAPPESTDFPEGYPLCNFRGTDDTADFIAHARADIPWLLDKMKTARQHAINLRHGIFANADAANELMDQLIEVLSGK